MREDKNGEPRKKAQECRADSLMTAVGPACDNFSWKDQTVSGCDVVSGFEEMLAFLVFEGKLQTF